MKKTFRTVSGSAVIRDISKIYELGRTVPEPPKNIIEPELSDNARYIASTRYARKNLSGEATETPKEILWRVAYNIATADRLYDGSRGIHEKTALEFYKLMATRRFLPNTPTLLNTAKPGQQLSACFVLPVPDSLEGILKTASDMAMDS